MAKASASRGKRCACGSGKHFRDCCAAAAAADSPARHSRPDVSCARHPPGAVCSGSPAGAADQLLRALNAGQWPNARLLASVYPVLETAFVGKASGRAAALRAGYDSWKEGLAGHAPRHAPLVSVVLAATGHDGDLAATLASLIRQTYGSIELIVVTPERDAVHRSLLEACPFPASILVTPHDRLPAQINHAVSHASGEFIELLVPGDRFDSRRIERMVRSVARAGGAWGYSGFRLDPASVASTASLQRLGLEIAHLLENIRGYDTTGFALLASIEVLPLTSNLFFSRKLFDALGGFAQDLESPHRDFALRALLQAEPFYVDEVLLDCRIASRTPGKARADHAGTQFALQRFMAKAAVDELPANPYAPVMPVWGDHFIAKLLGWKKLNLLSNEGLRKCLARAAKRAAGLQAQCQTNLPGLDIVSYFSAEMGLAESARGIARSCRAGAIPFGARSVELNLPQMRGDRSMDPWLVDSCRHSAALLHVNPDMLPDILGQMTAAELQNRYRIGYWYWETARIPEQWRYALDSLEEIWVATEFVARAVRQFTDKPVVKIHPPVDVPAPPPCTRSGFGLAEGRFLFLFSFDFSSYSARKNPVAVIQAFRRAFPSAREDVGLVIKSHGALGHPEKLRELHASIEGDARIRLIDRRMTRNEVLGLQSVCDAFVSLHRSEGLGLGLAECMAQGKAVIGTAYSGNLEFMNEDNSCLVDFRMVPVRPGEYLYDQPGMTWAEPDIDHAAWQMRRLADDPDFYGRIAAAGQAEISQRWNLQTTADAIRQRLREIGLLS